MKRKESALECSNKKVKQTVISNFFTKKPNATAVASLTGSQFEQEENRNLKFAFGTPVEEDYYARKDERRAALKEKLNETFWRRRPLTALPERSSIEDGANLTPLETQVLALKWQYPGVVLLFEVGYKYRFFEEDATVAAKELHISAFLSQHLLTASIPTQRLAIHVKKLVALGYKVGVVCQTETAALKDVSENKRNPFTRQLCQIYTKGTFVDDLAGGGTANAETADLDFSTNLVALLVSPLPGASKSRKFRASLVVFNINTGSFHWESVIDDLHEMHRLESLLHSIQPAEILVPCEDPAIKLKLGQWCNAFGCRIEESDSFVDREPLAVNLLKAKAAKVYSLVSGLEGNVQCCFASIIAYLEKLRLAGCVEHLCCSVKKLETCDRRYLKVSPETLQHLEILRRQDGSTKGSLFDHLNHTQTAMGKRLLAEWLKLPLCDEVALTQRRDAVTELKSQIASEAPHLATLTGLLAQLPDLESWWSKISLQKILHTELLSLFSRSLELLGALSKVRDTLESPLFLDICLCDSDCEILEKTFKSTLELFKPNTLTENLTLSDSWSESAFLRWPTLCDKFSSVQRALETLDEELQGIRKALSLPSLNYSTVAGIEFLVEISHAQAKRVPSDWVKVSVTKDKCRYHSLATVQLLKELQRTREYFTLELKACFALHLQGLARDAAQPYLRFSAAVAHIDCLLSLARAAQRSGYCLAKLSPESTLSPEFSVVGAVHPLVEPLVNAFVPNSLTLGREMNTLILSGPNMGGKSTFIRMVALLVLMNQTGCYIPCQSAVMGLFDGIYCRLGASDNIFQGESTFLKELLETSSILSEASIRSLVVIDELGRGTSTFDGLAIAQATLRYIITRTKSTTLFVTHFPAMSYFADEFPQTAVSGSMDYKLVTDAKTQLGRPVFLYKLKVNNSPSQSFGLNVALVAGLPESVVLRAKEVADKFALRYDLRAMTNIKRLLAL